MMFIGVQKRILSLAAYFLSCQSAHTHSQLLIYNFSTQSSCEHMLTSTGVRTTNLLRIEKFAAPVPMPTPRGYAPG